ncbi:MAG: hypothetical protein AMS24_00550 [Chlamydiae bacterium SM23_39]|nr:MAG: hypothetical protein AMS24_00550 [Chlamydiae bacterium SM23_39]
MKDFEILKKNLPSIEKKLNYIFKDKNLLFLSFMHPSFANENKYFKKDNERLEFLGDSVLNLIVSSYLYKMFSEKEGILTFFRSRLVDADSCAFYIKELDIDGFLLVGKGEQEDNRGKKSILADFFEAIIGAIYLDGGYLKAEEFFLNSFKKSIKKILENPIRNYKSEFQNYCQKIYKKIPLYEIIEEKGKEHEKSFKVRVILDNKIFGIGKGYSKKGAEQIAAKEAIGKLKI